MTEIQVLQELLEVDTRVRVAHESLVRQFSPLFEPKTIAVVGASATKDGPANKFIRHLRNFGFEGDIFPIHPSAPLIEGLPAYSSFDDTPESIDYAFVAVASSAVGDLLAQAHGRVRFAQVMSSGFSEIANGRAREEALVLSARKGGVRLLGPNCLGTYSPRGKVTFFGGVSNTLGDVGVISQSGGLGKDIVRQGLVRGLRFSGLVTVGNSADIGPNDLLEFYLADIHTKVVALYVEDVKDGRRFFNILREAKAQKPVIILKGGRTPQGKRAAQSHTGSLAGDSRVWEALSKQTGCILVEDLEEFFDALLAFQTLTPREKSPTNRVALFGNGGGATVLATDCFARFGLDVFPFEKETIEALERIGLPPGASLKNPVDTPAGALYKEEGRVAEKIIDTIFSFGKPGAFVMHLNMPILLARSSNMLSNLMQAALRVQSRYSGKGHFVIVLRSDGGAEFDIEKRKQEYRAQALSAGIAVYDELRNAAVGLSALHRYESFQYARQHISPVSS